MPARFAGYFEYMPGHMRAEFVVTGDSRLPDNVQVGWEVLQRLRIPRPPYPSYWEFVRERFGRLREIRKMLDKVAP